MAIDDHPLFARHHAERRSGKYAIASDVLGGEIIVRAKSTSEAAKKVIRKYPGVRIFGIREA